MNPKGRWTSRGTSALGDITRQPAGRLWGRAVKGARPAAFLSWAFYLWLADRLGAGVQDTQSRQPLHGYKPAGSSYV